MNSPALTRDYMAEAADAMPPPEFDPATACLVVVDLQYAVSSRELGLGRLLADQGRGAEAEYRFRRIEERVVPNVKRLLTACRGAGVRCVFHTYGSEVDDFSDVPRQLRAICELTNNRVGAREHDVLDELKPRPDERVFNKLTTSAFNSTPFELVMRAHGIETLIVTGVSTNMCVESTLRDAADRGWRCLLVEDACAADSQEMHDATVRVISRGVFGRVTSTDAVLAILRDRENPFRARSGR